MGRTIKLLTAKEVERIKEPGLHPVDSGLYLQIASMNSRSWIHRFTLQGKARWSGLGGYPELSLADARARRDAERAQLRAGVDPVAERKQLRGDKTEARPKKLFRHVAADYIANHEGSWKNPVHRNQWTSTLATYAYPVIGDTPVDEISTESVRQVLQPIWYTKAETARRVRGRIESVLDFAKTLELRDGDNPSRWKGHLENVFPKRKKQAIRHHPALPYKEIGGFMARLRERDGIGAKALEFTILTTARTSEVICARWDEFDLPNRMWIVPPQRMKANKEHRVPLSEPAVAVLEEMAKIRTGDLVFPLSNAAMLAVLNRMGHGDLTVHGFRSSFKDWATDWAPSPAEIVEAARRGELVEAFPRDLVEVAQAHTLDDKTEEAYRRTDMIEKRRRLMEAWAKFCSKAPIEGNVVDLPTVQRVMA